jgi:Fic family protein
MYVYQYKNWPTFHWNSEPLLSLLGNVRHLQGRLMGMMQSLGFENINEARLSTMTLDVLKTSEIEGEKLNLSQVRSSVAKRLGIEYVGIVPSDRNVDGVVDMMIDATKNFQKPLTKKRICDWHKALFPTGMSGMFQITVGDWRKNDNGPMQVVSGHMGKEKVHFQAPDQSILEAEMKAFLKWVNADQPLDPVLKACIAHFWFITIHPFDDGNGRIARALTDMLLARADGSEQRFYSMSAQIRVQRKGYYKILELTQKDDLEITNWMVWFLDCLYKSILQSEKTLQQVLSKADFWKTQQKSPMNTRQLMVLNKMLDGFKGKMTTTKYAKLCKCSSDTALRDIQDMISKDALMKEEGGGRSTSYVLKKI